MGTRKPRMSTVRRVFLGILPILTLFYFLVYVLFRGFVAVGNTLYSRTYGKYFTTFDLQLRILWEPYSFVRDQFVSGHLLLGYGYMWLWLFLIVIMWGWVVLLVSTIGYYIHTFARYRW